MDNFDLVKYLAENKLLEEVNLKDKKLITIKFKNEIENNRTQFVQLSGLSYRGSANPDATKEDFRYNKVRGISGSVYEGKLEATDVQGLKNNIDSIIFLCGLKDEEDENIGNEFYISVDSGNQSTISAVGEITAIS